MKQLLKLPPKLKFFNCSGCLLLPSIPTLPDTLKKFFCNSVNVTKLPKLVDTSITVLEARSCIKLLEFPELPATIELFDCQDCILLNLLPKLPNSLRILIANNCSSLKSIFAFPPNLRAIHCADCSNLSHFPEQFPVTLQLLDFRNCPELGEIPELNDGLKEIYYTGNPKIKLKSKNNSTMPYFLV